MAGSPVVTEQTVDGMLHLPEVVHQQFHLSTNPAENERLRSEFYYEQVWICTFYHPSQCADYLYVLLIIEQKLYIDPSASV